MLRWSKPTSTDVRLGVDVLVLRWSKPTSTDIVLSGLRWAKPTSTGGVLSGLRWAQPTSAGVVLSGIVGWAMGNGIGPRPCLVLVLVAVQSYIATVEAMERGVAGGVGSQGSVFAIANEDAEPDVAAIIPVPDNTFGSLGSS